MQTLQEASVDAIVTDPPYHLTNDGGGPHNKKPNAYSRAQAGAGSGGFMGQKWDGGDVAFRVETWSAALRVLKPGGYLLAFSGTRTYHRMACAIEDAGFEIRDQIGWAYGSGFPKSHNGPWGGTALKPAWEPICMARKPLQGTVDANWRKYGTGALNIDVCRIPFTGDADESESKTKNRHADFDSGPRENNVYGADKRARGENGNYDPPGRWPANVIHDGSDDVLAAFPESSSGHWPTDRGAGGISTSGHAGQGGLIGRQASTGSAARFFYCAKADRADRNEGGVDNTHPTVKPTDLMRHLCRLVTPVGGTVLDPFAGSGSTIKAAELEGFSAIGIEMQAEYIEIARRRVGGDAPLFASVEVA